MRTVDPAKHEARRRQILDAATACFARNGFHETTTAAICAQAGMSSGNLFHYFPSKRAVFAAIFEQEGRDTAALLKSAAASDDPWGALLALIDALTTDADDPLATRFVLEVAAHAGRDAEFATLLARNDRALRHGLAGLLARAAAAGQIDPPVSPDAAATWVAALIDGVYSRATLDPAFVPADQRPTVRLILERFLRAEGR